MINSGLFCIFLYPECGHEERRSTYVISMSKVSTFLTKFYTVLFIFAMLILTVMSLFRSEYFELGRDIEVPEYQWDYPMLVLIVFLIAVLLCHFTFRKYSLWFPYQALVVSFVAAAVSLSFLLILKSRPYMDCGQLLEIASQFNHGDYSALSTSSHNSYLYIYPFQIGFIAFEQLVFLVFGDGNYFAVQVINVAAVYFMARCLYAIAGELVGSALKRKVQSLAGILIILDFPLFIGTTFVYGDILGWTFACGAVFFLLHWISKSDSGESDKENKKGVAEKNRSSWRWLMPVPLLLATGYLLKTNILIFVIAVCIILFLETLRQKNWYPFLIAVITLLLTFAVTQAVHNHYAVKAHIEKFPEGTPATCWIAMGMLEDDNFENGWYNAYNVRTFEQSGYNTEVADQIARDKIQERLHTFISHPRYAVKFYLRKFISAWNDPQFDSQIKMEWGSRHVESLGGVARWMIYGRGRSVLYWIMNLLHFLILCGTFIETIRAFVRKDCEARLASYCLLPILGGMLFHLIWETQARYMVGYYSLMFPLAAAGIIHLALHPCRVGGSS